jgi:folate-dependent tRNA-U54 methylase TrmFO/GidA
MGKGLEPACGLVMYSVEAGAEEIEEVNEVKAVVFSTGPLSSAEISTLRLREWNG